MRKVVSFLLLILFGCTEVRYHFTVVSISPSGGSGNVARDVQIEAIFSEAVDEGTLTPENIFLLDSQTGEPVPGSISYNPETFTALYQPDVLLSYSRSYTFVITRNVKSRSGKRLPAEVRATFRTVDPPSLFIISVSPSPESTEAGSLRSDGKVNLNVKVLFSEPVDPQSVRAGETFRVYPSSNPSADVSGTIAFTENYTELTFSPSGGLNASTWYTVWLSRTIKSAIATESGGSLTEDVSFSFKTVNPPPLQIIYSSPSPFADNVGEVDLVTGKVKLSPIEIAFSLPVDPATLIEGTTLILDPPFPYVITLSADSTRVFINPSSDFDASTTYTIILEQGVESTIATAEGGFLSERYVLNFKTSDPPPLRIVAVKPSPNGENVDVTTSIEVIFDQAIDSGSFTTNDAGASFILRKCADASCTSFLSPDPLTCTLLLPPDVPETKASLVPQSSLEYNSYYLVSLSSSIRSKIATPEGGYLAEPFSFVFHTMPVPPLSVVEVRPESGAVGVSLWTQVKVTFNAGVYENSVTRDADGDAVPDNFYVVPCLNQDCTSWDAPLTAFASYDHTTYTAILTFPAPLSFDTLYKIFVRGGSAGITGLQGQILPADFTSTFRTRVSNLILSTDPQSGQTGVSVSTSITVIFAECMDPSTITSSSFYVTFQDSFSRTVVLPGTITFNNTAGCSDISGDGLAGVNEAVFTPDPGRYNCLNQLHPLLYNTTYTVHLTSQITTEDAAASIPDTNFSFTTGDPPLIQEIYAENTHTKVSPLKNAQDVPVNSHVTVIFSRDMDALSLLVDSNGNGVPDNVFINQGYVSDETSAIPATAVYSERILTLYPGVEFAFEASYTLTLRGGMNGVRDTQGNFLEDDYIISFRTSPANTADAVPYQILNAPTDWAVAVVLSRPLDPLQVNDTTFYLYNQSTGEKVGGLISISRNRRLISISPVPELDTQTDFLIVLTQGLLDFTGNPYPSLQSFGFRTASQTDQAAPSIFSTSPADGESGIPGNVEIKVTFDEHIIPESIRASDPPDPSYDTILLDYGGGATYIAGEISFEFDHVNYRTTVIFRPKEYLKSGLTYRMTLTDKIADLASTAFGGAQFSFTIETTAPVFAGSDPADGSADVSVTVPVKAYFSDATPGDGIDPASVNETSFYLLRSDSTRLTGGSYVTSGTVVIYYPPAPFKGGETYTAVLSSTITDYAGNSLDTWSTFTFTTESTPPSVTASVPADGETGVSVSPQIVIYFSEPVDPSTVTGSVDGPSPVTGSVQVFESDTGDQVYGCISVQGSKVYFDPVDSLKNSTEYTIYVSTDVTDLGGTPMSFPFSATFVTE